MKNKKININIIISLIITIYFIGICFLYRYNSKEFILNILKVLSMLIMIIDIILMELAFRKDDGKIAINSVEILVLAFHTLSILHVVEIQKINFISYIIISAVTFIVYFLTKLIWIQTKERKKYLNSLSDIKEIVTNTPTKKEAKKINK